MAPYIGRTVTYRATSYDCPAIVTGTVATLGAVPPGGVPPLSSDEHVHLFVLTPSADAILPGGDPGIPVHLTNGAYQAFNCPPADTSGEIAVGTWRSRQRV